MKKTTSVQRILTGALALAGIISLVFLAACPNDPEPAKTYSITKGSYEHGDFELSSEKAAKGSTITLYPTADIGYVFKSFSSTPEATFTEQEDGSWTFKMPGKAIVINALFEQLPPDTFSITKEGTPQNGDFDINPTSAKEGDTVTLTAKPVENYVLDKFTTVPAAPVSGTGNTWTFTMPKANVKVSATFIEKPPEGYYRVTKGTITGKGSFTINPDTSYVEKATTVTLTATPDAGYEVGEWTITPTVTVTAGTEGKYTFTMPENEIKIDVTFTAIVYTITQGTVTGDGTFSISKEEGIIDDTITLTFAADPDWRLKEFTSDPVVTFSGTTGTTRTFKMPASDITVNVVFEEIPTFAITTGAHVNGDFTFKVGANEVVKAQEGAMITVTSVPDSGYRLIEWVISPDTVNPEPVSANPGTYTFSMPGAEVSIGGRFGITPAPGTDDPLIIEDWDFLPGEWVEYTNTALDQYFHRYPNGDTIKTEFGTFKDSADTEMKGVLWEAPVEASQIGWRFIGENVTNGHNWDLTGYTQISVWVLASQAGVFETRLNVNDAGSTASVGTYIPRTIAAGDVDVWTELVIPITEFGTATVTNISRFNGIRFQSPADSVQTFCIGPITAIK